MAKEEQIKTSIDLTGEKEYRAACTNINSSLREIGSEMKLTTKRTSKKTQQRARNNRPCPPSLYRRNASSLERSRSMAHDTV